jgi:hypothetical protein
MNEKDIYAFIDKWGIPFRQVVKFGVRVEENEQDIFQDLRILNDEDIEEYIKNDDIIISKIKSSYHVVPNLPMTFKLDVDEQSAVIYKWFYETTGYRINDLNTLKELPVLHNNPFVLQVTRGYNENWFVLGGQEITGDLSIRKKVDDFGRMGQNWIRSFGSIKKVKGNVYVDISMKDFGKLEIVDGDLAFSNHVYQDELISLTPLVEVRGDLNLKNTHLSLGSLEVVYGNLNLRKTTVHDLGQLKSVRGNVLITKSQADKINLTKVEIGGKIKMYNDTFNLGQLTPPTY